MDESYVTEFVHQRAHTWKGDVERFLSALYLLGEARFRAVLQRALMQRLVGAEDLERLAVQMGEHEGVAS